MKSRKVILEINGKLIDDVFTYKTAYEYAVQRFEESFSNKTANIYVKGELVTTIKNNKVNVKQTAIQKV
jgi:hypothetical protein